MDDGLGIQGNPALPAVGCMNGLTFATPVTPARICRYQISVLRPGLCVCEILPSDAITVHSKEIYQHTHYFTFASSGSHQSTTSTTGACSIADFAREKRSGSISQGPRERQTAEIAQE